MPIFKRPLFWLVILVLATGAQKLDGFGKPLLDHHAWRQADTAAIARNFAAGDMNILYPQVDWGGPGPNYCETEFPLYSWGAAALANAGIELEKAGRILSLLAYLVQILLAFLIGRRLLGSPWRGLLAALLYALSPIAGFMGRAFMPESWVWAAALASAFFFLRWLEGGKAANLAAAVAFLALAAALKLTALYLLLFYGLLILLCRRRALASPWPYAALVLALVPAGLWYWHAHGIYLQTGLTFGIWVAGDKWATAATLFSGEFWRKMATVNWPLNLLTWPGFILALAGTTWLLATKAPGRGRILAWLAAAFVYSLVLARGVFEHDYYSLPLLAPAALAAAYAAAEGLALFKKNVLGKVIAGLIILALAAAVPSYTGRYRGFTRVENEGAVWAGEFLKQKYDDDAPIVTFNNGGPHWLYYCGRQGWILSPKGGLLENPRLLDSFLERYRRGGARYLVVDMDYYGLMADPVQRYLDRQHKRLHLGDGYAAWRLLAAGAPK